MIQKSVAQKELSDPPLIGRQDVQRRQPLVVGWLPCECSIVIMRQSGGRDGW